MAKPLDYPLTEFVHSPLLDRPPIRHLTAVVLKTIDILPPEMRNGTCVIHQISLDCSTQIDPSQIFKIVRRLFAEGLIEKKANLKSEHDGPPLKLVELTEKGRKALEIVSEHHRQMAEFLE